MKDLNNNKYWLLALPFVGVLLWKLFRNTANIANRETDTLNESTAQATKFYSYFGIVNVGGFAVATPVVLTSTKNNIALLVQNIDDWSVVQQVFTKLCGGNYTVLKAASSALNTSDYNGFTNLLQKALTQKRIYCKRDSHSLKNVNQYGGTAAENFESGNFVGRCQSEDEYYYYYISQKDGNTYACDKDYFFTIN